MNDGDQHNKIVELSKKKIAKQKESETLAQIKKEQEKLEKLIKQYNAAKKMGSGLRLEYILRYLQAGCNPEYLPYGCDPNMKHGTYNVWCYWVNDSTNPRVVVLDKETKTATEISNFKLLGIIDECLKRFDNPDFASSTFCLSSAQQQALSTKIRANGRKISIWPKTIGFKSDNEYCFKRYDFDPSPKPTTYKDFPTIALNLENMTNAKNFCQRVGSLYDPNANRKQIIFMVGKGDGGKSTLLNILTMLAGGVENVATVSRKVFDTHGYAPLLNKRVWIAEELSKSFFKNEKSKELTGGAPVLINQKNEPLFSAYLTGMLFCVSNDMPEFGDDSGLRNRLIICELKPIPIEKRLNEFETLDRMKRELPYFVRYCMDVYKDVDKSGVLAPGSTDTLESIIHENELEVSVMFERYFKLGDLHDIPTEGVTGITSREYHDKWEWICENNKSFANIKGIKAEFNKYVKKVMDRKTLTENRKYKGTETQVRCIPGLWFRSNTKV